MWLNENTNNDKREPELITFNFGLFLNRYLEEWLKMMTVAHIVEIDETEKKFFLPTHRRAALVSTTNPVGFALNATPSLTYNHDSIIDCFKTSGPSCELNWYYLNLNFCSY